VPTILEHRDPNIESLIAMEEWIGWNNLEKP